MSSPLERRERLREEIFHRPCCWPPCYAKMRQQYPHSYCVVAQREWCSEQEPSLSFRTILRDDTRFYALSSLPVFSFTYVACRFLMPRGCRQALLAYLMERHAARGVHDTDAFSLARHAAPPLYTSPFLSWRRGLYVEWPAILPMERRRQASFPAPQCSVLMNIEFLSFMFYWALPPP